MTFGQQLRQRREAARIGLRELGRRTELDPAYLHRLETGQTVPTDATLKRIAPKLGVSVKTLKKDRDDARLDDLLPDDVSILLKEEGPLTPERRIQLLEAAKAALETAETERPAGRTAKTKQ